MIAVSLKKHSNLWVIERFHGDVPVDEQVAFDMFLEQFQNFVVTLDGENLNSWSERTTINRVIKPILEILGYESSSNKSVEPWLEDEPFTVQESDGLKTYKPDFILVDDHKYLKYIQNEKGHKKLEEARSSVILSIEAKYWGRIDEYYNQHIKEDTKRADKKSNSESSKAMDFDEQCLKYMEILSRPYGILTDGKIWRLYSLSFSSPSHRPYFQFNLGHMIKHIQNSDFLKKGSESDRDLFEKEIKYFYFIFRKKSLHSVNGEELFADELLNYSKKYVARVEEDLKVRFVNAMTIACNGFQRAVGNQKYDIDLIRSVSESHIFNMLFLKYCETKNILPIKQDPEGYRRTSISDLLDRLENFDPHKEEDNLNELLLKRMFRDINYSPNGVELYNRLLNLTKIVQHGTNKEFKNFSVKGFKESIFSNEEWAFVNKFKLTNKEMINILFEIGYSESDVRGRKYQQIPYNSFSPRQLGSIYESFLEFKLDRAKEDMAFIKKQWVPANLKSGKIRSLDVPKVKKGDLFFTPNNEERKATGSYYTPDDVVQFVVKNTLESLVKGKSSDEILSLRVCDPAMGSGHFLSASLDFLAKKYNDALVSETNDDLNLPSAVVKKKILKHCIYGIDINPRAVKLGKMSLWLESATTSGPLEDLDDQITSADSLMLLKCPYKDISCFLMNPPWVLQLQNDNDVSTNDFYQKHFKSADGFKKNLFPLFVEQVCRWLEDCSNSSIGMVIPNRLFDTPSYAGAREKLLNSFNDIQIYKLSSNTFDNVTASSVAAIAKKNKKRGHEVTLWDESRTQKIDIDVKSLDSDFRFNLNSEIKYGNLVDIIKNNSENLVDSFFCHVGMMVKNNKETFLTNETRHSKNRIVKGRLLSPIHIKDTFFFNYSKANIFGGTKRLEKHTATPKLLLRKTGNTLLCAIDDSKDSPVYAEQSVYLVIPKKEFDSSILVAICAYINSRFATAFYRSELITNPDSYPYIQQYDLENLPIPKMIFDKEIARGIAKNWKKRKPTDIISDVEAAVSNKLKIKIPELD